MVDNEQIIWEKMLRGDEKAFSFIYEKYSKQLYLYGLKFTPNTVIVEDCIQDLFVSIFNNSKISSTDNIQFYLFRSFRNRLIRMLSREEKYHGKQAEDHDFGVIFSVEKSIIEDEMSERVRANLKTAIDGLSKRQKEAVYLRYTKGLSYKEIAGIMDMEVESCRNTISRAVKNIRSTMKTFFILFFPGFFKHKHNQKLT
ncbi:MAG: sigma-70 family RNA polymerase sigma factor [Prolixibacteraceae bacterium]|jgi:RNA polymerase sigma factor (sigma-70 family)|nr:sigma-70 family RNA polymerase sigma factor [Prolixibacteraceae bacterium]